MNEEIERLLPEVYAAQREMNRIGVAYEAAMGRFDKAMRAAVAAGWDGEGGAA